MSQPANSRSDLDTQGMMRCRLPARVMSRSGGDDALGKCYGGRNA